MVDVASGSEVDGDLKMELTNDVILACGCGLGCQRCVEGVDVCLVVLCMVEGHDLSADLGF